MFVHRPDATGWSSESVQQAELWLDGAESNSVVLSDRYDTECEPVYEQFKELQNKINKIQLEISKILGLEEAKEMHEVEIKLEGKKMAEAHSKLEREDTNLEMDEVKEMAEVETKLEIEQGKVMEEAESKLEDHEMSEELTVISAEMEGIFAHYRDGWQSLWSSKFDRCGSFTDTSE
jgi:DNA integrity scanning protein DisA with diadenylate cyclase activity